MATDNRSSFWRRSPKVPGRHSKETRSRFQTRTSRASRASSFHEFARSTNDAWDLEDEEDPVPGQNRYRDPQEDPVPGQNLREDRTQQDQTREDRIPQEDRIQEPQVNGKVTKSSSEELHLNTSSAVRSSLPVRPLIPLVARISDQNASGAPPSTVRDKSRLDKFRQLLGGTSPDLEELRQLSWSGIPREVRPVTWRLLSGYLPANSERRQLVLQRKREEYFRFIEQYYQSRTEEGHRDTYRQIHIDIPRTNPLIPLFQQPAVQEVFERILFIWAIRHPASGYVQGINDLVTPFFVVFLSEFVTEDVENFDVAALPLDTQRNIEADSFWCMSKLLDGIQDNYTFAQPGIQNKVKALEELVSRIDEDVHQHFRRYEVEYLQFAFRWMNNLLMRELPLRCTIRLWDTYQAEADGFSHFHLYVCAAFLLEWRKEILSMVDFQGLLMLLQNLPTIHWGNEEVGLLLAEAYRLKYMFADAPSHYRR
ncbi:TBC1 domain family member 22B isoform X2 [Cololabis saira]|uniref:TBC1 domain family member 22B isoform X2 n=1 Tax=Cololabis saira TaxID=129043 RepID=UPI002AD44439|nr:TBC1 domain family member 22B isoform X2 [Cololabis saira]